MSKKNQQCIAIVNKTGLQCTNDSSKVHFPFCGPHQNWVARGNRTIHSDGAVPFSESNPIQQEITKAVLSDIKEMPVKTESADNQPMTDMDTADSQFAAELHAEHDKIIMLAGNRAFRDLDRNIHRWSYLFLKESFQLIMKKYDSPLLITGMARGWDAFGAMVAMDKDVRLPILAAVPSPTFGEYYWKGSLDQFNKYLDYAKYTVYVSGDHGYGKANFARNEWMVKHANHTCYAWNSKDSSGTNHALRLVTKAGLPIVRVDQLLDGFIKARTASQS